MPNHGTELWWETERMESKLYRPLIQWKKKHIATDDHDEPRRIEVPMYYLNLETRQKKTIQSIEKYAVSTLKHTHVHTYKQTFSLYY